MTTTQRIDALQLAEVETVYSGRPGACCCGCAGKYYHAPQHIAAVNKSHGYDCSDEVNPQMVKRIFHMLKAEAEKATDFGTGFSVRIGNREYNVYVAQPAQQEVK